MSPKSGLAWTAAHRGFRNRHAWRRWKYDWITPAQPGHCTLLARAVGADQRGQPDAHDPNFGSYVIDHPLPIEVFVAAV
jgi:hypothetical protein